MLVIDPDHVIEWQMKNAQHWIWEDDQYLCHQVLLLGPPGEPDTIFCCVVVWIYHDQATITVPQALEHLTTVIPQDMGNLTLCKILVDTPFWPSLPSDDESYLITLSATMPQIFSAGCLRCYMLTMESHITEPHPSEPSWL